MTNTTFESFKATQLAAGFDEVIERSWQPNTVLDTHTHPFAVDALVVQGEMWLTIDGKTQHLLPQDRFTLARDVPHEERYGAQGATYWVARKTT
jgi:quercetin dioxygenase-like cupin family protein